MFRNKRLVLLPVIAKVLRLHIHNGQGVAVVARTHLSAVGRLQRERVLEPGNLESDRDGELIG